MGSSNRAMWKEFGISCNKNSAMVNKIPHPCNPDKSLYVLADVPHIIKNLRNHLANGQSIIIPPNLMKKHNLTSNIVNIEPLRKLALYQQDLDLKPAPKLTLKLLEPSHFDKMKVSMALNVFSHSVSSALKLMVDTEKWDSETLTTAWFIEMMDSWFNIMSSRHPALALSKFSLEKYHSAISFLNNIIEIFQNISIGQKGWKPVQTGVILSTKSVLDLQKYFLDDCDFKFFLTARLSQDCLENLFSCIRSRNPVPTSLEFKHHLRLITVAQYLKPSEYGSYEQDDGGLIADFLDVKPVISQETDVSFADEVYVACAPFNVDDILSTQSEEFCVVELNCLYYVGGYVLSRICKHEHCAICITAVKCDEPPANLDPNITKLVETKEYRTGCLVYCTHLVYSLILCAEIIFRKNQLNFLSAVCNITDKLITDIDAATSHLVFPNCHNIKTKIISRYIIVRMHFFAKKEQKLQESSSKNKVTYELGSKSMTMHKLVKNVQ
jgi:hypothetical protein